MSFSNSCFLVSSMQMQRYTRNRCNSMYTISSAENDIRAVTQIYALVTLKYLYISTFYSYYYYIYITVYIV
ncbi:hypothetical protein [Escherichia phage PH1062]|nr:hypothetical protein [Escherichia phage PH1062]